MKKRKYIDLMDVLVNLYKVTDCYRYTDKFLSDLFKLLEATGLYEDVNSISRGKMLYTIYVGDVKVGRYCEHHPLVLNDMRKYDRSVFLESRDNSDGAVLVFYGDDDYDESDFPDKRDNGEEVKCRLDSDLQTILYLLLGDLIKNSSNTYILEEF